MAEKQARNDLFHSKDKHYIAILTEDNDINLADNAGSRIFENIHPNVYSYTYLEMQWTQLRSTDGQLSPNESLIIPVKPTPLAYSYNKRGRIIKHGTVCQSVNQHQMNERN